MDIDELCVHHSHYSTFPTLVNMQNKEYLVDRTIRSDFKVFLTLIWRELNLPTPTRAQFAIADYLQHGG